MMIRLFVCLLFSVVTMAQDAELCGLQDARVCLTNSTAFVYQSGQTAMRPGSAVVIKLPGVESTAPLSAAGSPTVTYRMQAAGSVDDNAGGLWSEPQVVMGDEDSVSALAFVLESGQLQNPQINLRNIQVCQRVLDGPTEVLLEVQIWLVHSKGRATLKQSFNYKMTNQFSTCKAFDGYLPLYGQGSDLKVTNPYDQTVSFSVNNHELALEPGANLSVRSVTQEELVRVSSNVDLPMVVVSEEGDLNLTGLRSKDNNDFLIAHLARNTDVWRNSWVMASGQDTVLDWQMGDQTNRVFVERGVHRQTLELDAENPSGWARLQSDRVFNGYFEFSKKVGGGSAAVNALRIADQSETPGAHVLYLPHVAADTERFWTGWSVANPNNTPANITMHAIGLTGQIITSESFTIEAGENSLGLVGVDRLVDVPGISWVRFESDQPIAGLELVGQYAQDGTMAGFLLPRGAQDNLVFPFLRASDQWWSGLSVLNGLDIEVLAELTFYDENHQALRVDTVFLQPGAKQLFLAPPGAVQAVCKGEGLIGFCLVGDNDLTRMGGYLGE